ncbi:aldose epimerase family protein [Reinekea sp.]|jgi:aldose 1-epimerase|uniref:aldose epimerase family protein n=1 Tax=Reinekea sp. TaxID=1970455 RepID=UPI002A7ED7CB|nr:aldose epimerase family protein [Reinekea sp.]
MKQSFGQLQDGTAVSRYCLTNEQGVTVSLLDLGAVIHDIIVPDRAGQLADITLGFADAQDYAESTTYFGAVIGRYANRIRGGAFELVGQPYQLAKNNGPNHLHGGLLGFDKRLWTVGALTADSIEFSLISVDGDQGYPGTLYVSVRYRLDNNNQLSIEYRATTDQTTLVNLTQHSYFNLSGQLDSTVLDHQVQIFADRYTPVDASMIPTGVIAPVAGSALDLSQPTLLADSIDQPDEQLLLGGGYDHNYVLNSAGDLTQPAAIVRHPASGRVLTLYTDLPGMQFYSGNFLAEKTLGKQGIVYPKRSGLCLETQLFPDTPNQPDFPSAILHPGETWHSTTLLHFSVDD